MLTILYTGWAGGSNAYCVIAAAQYPCGLAAIPLANDETVTINMSKQMSAPSWQKLIDPLELWKKQAGAAEPQWRVKGGKVEGYGSWPLQSVDSISRSPRRPICLRAISGCASGSPSLGIS
jgi:hypothetical protein